MVRNFCVFGTEVPLAMTNKVFLTSSSHWRTEKTYTWPNKCSVVQFFAAQRLIVEWWFMFLQLLWQASLFAAKRFAIHGTKSVRNAIGTSLIDHSSIRKQVVWRTHKSRWWDFSCEKVWQLLPLSHSLKLVSGKLALNGWPPFRTIKVKDEMESGLTRSCKIPLIWTKKVWSMKVTVQLKMELFKTCMTSFHLWNTKDYPLYRCHFSIVHVYAAKWNYKLPNFPLGIYRVE